jgi:hypothetical protein
MALEQGRSAAEAAAEKKREVFDDHEALRGMLARIEDSTDIRRLPLLLVELRGLLKDHFSLEEAADGLAAVVRDHAPNHLHRLDAIMSQHPGLLEALDELVGQARALVIGPLADLEDELHAWCQRLHEHESAETRLLTDTLYTDLGESP